MRWNDAPSSRRSGGNDAMAALPEGGKRPRVSFRLIALLFSVLVATLGAAPSAAGHVQSDEVSPSGLVVVIPIRGPIEPGIGHFLERSLTLKEAESRGAGARTISAVQSTFRSTAELRGRNPVLEEAMVDPEVTVPGLDSATTLLPLPNDQAVQWQYANGVATDRNDLLTQLDLSGAEITEMSPTVMEEIVRWVTDPIVARMKK